jgi:hypothetical protein
LPCRPAAADCPAAADLHQSGWAICIRYLGTQGKALLSVLEGAQLAGKTVGAGGEACLRVLGGTTAETLGILTVFTNESRQRSAGRGRLDSVVHARGFKR